MSLKPLLDSDWTIQLHVAAAMGALVLGIVQLWFAKGDGPHRLRGWIWVALMLVVSVSAPSRSTSCGSGVRGARSISSRSSR